MRRGAGFSPRPWGCVARPGASAPSPAVFPTPVGVCRSQVPAMMMIRFPHARGGVSRCIELAAHLSEFSPRPWGCVARVSRARGNGNGFPHARGGVSRVRRQVYTQAEFSPRPWGCVEKLCQRVGHDRVFPTPVGVCREIVPAGRSRPRSPHARGGVSPTWIGLQGTSAFSPRPWGCVYTEPRATTPARLSPRPWGCVEPPRGGDPQRPAFPTPVGMCRVPIARSSAASSFPHAGGGVSGFIATWAAIHRFPHGGGDVPSGRRTTIHARRVFPTGVGMCRTRW